MLQQNGRKVLLLMNLLVSLHEIFIERKENAILLGTADVGKSHLAISLAAYFIKPI
jgi:DNA replication protein DnaC